MRPVIAAPQHRFQANALDCGTSAYLPFLASRRIAVLLKGYTMGQQINDLEDHII